MEYFRADTPTPPYLAYPRFLLKMPLNETARLVYILLLSRIQLSQANGMVDEDGNVFCRYPITALAKDSGKSETTVKDALRDLQEQKLIARKHQGMGNANKIYLPLPPEIRLSPRRNPGRHRGGKPSTNHINKLPDYHYTGGSL